MSQKEETKLSDQKFVDAGRGNNKNNERSEVKWSDTNPREAHTWNTCYGENHGVASEAEWLCTRREATRQNCAIQDGWKHRDLYYVQNSMLYVVVHRKEEKDGVGMMSNASHYREK